MKRTFRTIILILAAVLVCTFGWFLYRHLAPEPRPMTQDPIYKESIPEIYLSDQESVEAPEAALAELPPHCLSFDDIKAYQDFFFAAELDDDDFLKYIRKNNFEMNGIRSKEDLTDLTEKLYPVPFPVVTGAQLTHVEILPEHDQLFLRYTYIQDVCTFQIDYTELLRNETAPTAAENLPLWNELVLDDLSVQRENEYRFVETIHGCTVRCDYYGSEANARGMIEKATTFVSAVKPLKENSDLTKEGPTDLPITDPDSISFQTIETYWGFFFSAEQSDERFMLYLEKNGFNMNGIRSKDDLYHLTATLMSVPFPMVKGATMIFGEILPGYSRIDLQYRLLSGDICTFLIDYSEMVPTEQTFALEEHLRSWDQNVCDDYAAYVSQYADCILEESIPPWDNAAFDTYSYDEKLNAHQSLEEVNGCSVLYTYYGSEADARAVMEEYTYFISATGFSAKK